jgi:hypothetical protein
MLSSYFKIYMYKYDKYKYMHIIFININQF